MSETPGPQLAHIILSIQHVHLGPAYIPQQTFGGLLEQYSKYEQM